MNYIKRNIEWLITSFFVILIPLVYSENQADPVLYSRYMALSVWLLLITIVLIVKTKHNSFTFFLSSTDKVFFSLAGLFVFVNLLSSLVGVHNFSEAIFKSSKEFSFLLMLFYFHQMLRNKPSGINILVKSVVVMTAFFQGIALYQFSQVDFTEYLNATEYFGYYFRQATHSVISTQTNINIFGYFLFLSLSFSIYASVFYNKYWRVFSIIVSSLSFSFIVLLSSKGGWLALIIYILINFLLSYFYLFFRYTKETGKKLANWMRLSLISMPIALIILIGILFAKEDSKITQLVNNKIENLINLELQNGNVKKQTTVKKRILLWENTVEIIKDNPVLGIGPGQWRIEYAKYGIDDYELQVRKGVKHYQRPHNDLLWILSETGFVGFVLFILMYIFILLLSVLNMLDSHKSNKARLFSMLAFSSLISFILVLSISFTRERVSHNLVYLLIMSLVLFFKDERLNLTSIINKKVLISVLSGFLIISIFNLVLANDMKMGEEVSQTIRIAKSQKNFGKADRAINGIEGSFYTMDGFSAPLPYYKALILAQKKNYSAAKSQFLQAYKTHPYHVLVLIDLGTIYDLGGQKDSALYFFQKALEISPRQKRALVSSAIVYYNMHKYTKSMSLLKRVSFEGKYPNNFKTGIVAVSHKIAQDHLDLLNTKKYKKWLENKNSPIITFKEYQKGDEEFLAVLIKELGK